MPSDLEIAQAATLKPIEDVADEMGLPPELLERYGRDVTKIELDAIEALADRPRAKYVVVTGDDADAAGRGQDADHGRPRRRR